MKLVISKIDEKLGLFIPVGLLARHHIKGGEKLYCPQVSVGGKITSSDADLADILEIVERIMREDHEVLRRLSE